MGVCDDDCCAVVDDGDHIMVTPIKKNVATLSHTFSSGTDSNAFPTYGNQYAKTMLQRTSHNSCCSRTHLMNERSRRIIVVTQSSRTVLLLLLLVLLLLLLEREPGAVKVVVVFVLVDEGRSVTAEWVDGTALVPGPPPLTTAAAAFAEDVVVVD